MSRPEISPVPDSPASEAGRKARTGPSGVEQLEGATYSNEQMWEAYSEGYDEGFEEGFVAAQAKTEELQARIDAAMRIARKWRMKDIAGAQEFRDALVGET